MKEINAVELAKEVPIFTILNTEEKGKTILVLHTNTGYHLIGLDATTKGEINISYDEVMAHSKKQLLELLKGIDKVFDKAELSYTEKSNPVASYPAVSKTDTTSLFEKGFKVLPESCVIKALDDNGINHDNLKYEVVRLSNAHNSLSVAKSLYQASIDSPVLSQSEQDLVDYIKAGAIRNIALVGPAGTGKTMFVKKIVNALGYTLEQRQNSLGVELDDIVGGIGVNTEDDSSRTYIKKDGLLTNSDQPKMAGLLDEINMGDARTTASLNNFLDDSGYFVDINGKKHIRHEDYVFFIAFNPGYDATSPLNQAFLDRFEIYTFLDITKSDFMKWLEIYDFKNNKFLEILYEAFAATKKSFANRNFKSEVTFRGIKRFMDKLITNMDLGKTITESRLHDMFNTSIVTKSSASEDVEYEFELEELRKESAIWCKDLYKAFKEGENTSDIVGQLKLEQEIALDDLEDFDSFGDIPIDESGIPIEEE